MKGLLLLLVLTLLPIRADAGVEDITPEHDTLTEYIVGIDTVITLYRIECDTAATNWVNNDSFFVRIDAITCVTVFHVRYENIWVPRVKVCQDSLQSRLSAGLLLIGKEVKHE